MGHELLYHFENSHFLELNSLQKKPSSEPPVFINRPPPEMRVFEGAPAEVSCDGFGDPLPIVYWIHSEVIFSFAVTVLDGQTSSPSRNGYHRPSCHFRPSHIAITAFMSVLLVMLFHLYPPL